jgi:hypothetical protein
MCRRGSSSRLASVEALATGLRRDRPNSAHPREWLQMVAVGHLACGTRRSLRHRRVHRWDGARDSAVHRSRSAHPRDYTADSDITNACRSRPGCRARARAGLTAEAVWRPPVRRFPPGHRCHEGSPAAPARRALSGACRVLRSGDATSATLLQLLGHLVPFDRRHKGRRRARPPPRRPWQTRTTLVLVIRICGRNGRAEEPGAKYSTQTGGKTSIRPRDCDRAALGGGPVPKERDQLATRRQGPPFWCENCTLGCGSNVSPDSAVHAIRGSRSTSCCEMGDAACAAPWPRPDECVRE